MNEGVWSTKRPWSQSLEILRTALDRHFGRTAADRWELPRLRTSTLSLISDLSARPSRPHPHDFYLFCGTGSLCWHYTSLVLFLETFVRPCSLQRIGLSDLLNAATVSDIPAVTGHFFTTDLL